MAYSTKQVQQRLIDFGYNLGSWGADGFKGPATDAAIVRFKVSVGLAARPYVGPITLQALFNKTAKKYSSDVPWMNEAAKYMGMHERRNFKALYAFLRSDGATLGDPRKLPWCGDFVDTCLRLLLPNEKRPGSLGVNPYLARNWLKLGYDCGPKYGAVVVFWRGRRNGYSGHVGFAVGYDPDRNRIRVRGGNQSNSVNDAWLDADRLLGYRCPSTFKGKLPDLPRLNSAGHAVSRNEV